MKRAERVMEDYAAMVRELMADDSDQLTAWEVAFVESMNKRLAFVRGEGLSVAQQNKISQVWHRIF